MGKSDFLSRPLSMIVCACRLQSKWYPGLHEKQHGQQVEGGDSAPLLCPDETSPGELWKGIDWLEQVQRRAMKVIRKMEQLFYRERMRELEMFILEKALG